MYLITLAFLVLYLGCLILHSVDRLLFSGPHSVCNACTSNLIGGTHIKRHPQVSIANYVCKIQNTQNVCETAPFYYLTRERNNYA